MISNLAIRESSSATSSSAGDNLLDIQEKITQANQCTNSKARAQLLTLCLR